MDLVRTEIFRIYLPVPLYAGIFFYLAVSLLRKNWNSTTSTYLLLLVYGVLAYRNAFRAILGPQFQVALPPLVILTVSLFERGHDALFIRGPDARLRRNSGSRFLLKAAAFGFLAVIAGGYFLASPKRYYGTLEGWLAYQHLKGGLVGTYSFPVPLRSLVLKESRVERIGRAMIPAWQDQKPIMNSSFIISTFPSLPASRRKPKPQKAPLMVIRHRALLPIHPEL